MKKSIFLLSILFLSLASFAQTIPNSDFESWESNTLPPYEQPDPWNTPNPYTSILGQVSVSKSNDAFSGSYSAQLKTIEIEYASNKIYAPGLLTYADFKIDFISLDYTFGGGVFLQQKVSKLKGKYKYQGAEGDSASVLIYCYRHPEGQGIDTIGVGLTFLHDAEAWTDFSVDMQFFNSRTPDTFNVLIMSTGTFEVGYMPPGSVLYVDDITIDTTLSAIPTNQSQQAKHYPNPTSNKLVIELEKDGNERTLSIIDINGRLVKEIIFDGNTVIADVSFLSEGIYTYRISDNKNIPVTGAFIKQ